MLVFLVDRVGGNARAPMNCIAVSKVPFVSSQCSQETRCLKWYTLKAIAPGWANHLKVLAILGASSAPEPTTIAPYEIGLGTTSYGAHKAQQSYFHANS